MQAALLTCCRLFSSLVTPRRVVLGSRLLVSQVHYFTCPVFITVNFLR